MKKDTGITLVALVITIIILLILAGVAISMITGGEGLFAQANGAATKYNQAAKNEADLLNQLLNGDYLNNGGNGQGGEEEPAISNGSHIGYYADLDPNDGRIDGIIFADSAVGGSGQWSEYENGGYTIPVKTGLKEYYISQTEYEGNFGTNDVLSPKAGSTGEDRFYIMSLESFGDSETYQDYTWYAVAKGKMTDYAEATSVDFGTGRANTAKMIEYWNNKTYGEQNSTDIWGKIQDKVAEGWFVPSRAELAAFLQELRVIELGVSKTLDAGRYGFNNFYWSSSLYNVDAAWCACFGFFVDLDFCMSYLDVDSSYEFRYIRLCATF